MSNVIFHFFFFFVREIHVIHYTIVHYKSQNDM